MGKQEAIADGIEFYFNPDRRARGRRGAIIYKVKCDVCGETVETLNYGRQLVHICNKCKCNKEQHKREVEKAWFDVIEEKGEHRFNQALDRIEAQVKDFSIYKRASVIARKAQHKYGSVPEAMVAIELIRLGLSFVPQQKVGRYRVDFYLPKQKIVIEVDGKVFHTGDSGERDMAIRRTLGWSCIIIHVPAEKIVNKIQRLGTIINEFSKVP